MEKTIERKLIARVGALLFLLYALFALDRGNVGFAALEMNKALGLTASLFGLGAGLSTLAYLAFQVPNIALMRRLGHARGLAAVGCAWGLVSAASAFAWNPASFLVFRVVLGVSEAGFHAYLIFLVSQLFPRRIQGLAIGLMLTAVPVSQVIASPLSGFLLDLNGGLQGWQWLFILEGVPSILVGLLCLSMIPNRPADAKFLTAEEIAWLEKDLAAAEAQVGHGSVSNVGQVLRSGRVWALGFVLFANILGVNTLLYWMPQIIQQMSGAGHVETGLLNALPWLTFAIGLISISRLSDRIAEPIPVLCLGLVIASAGFALSAVTVNAVVPFIGLLVGAFGIGAAQALFWVVAMKKVRGTAAASAFGVITLIGNGSGVFAHGLIGWARDTTGSFSGVVLTLGAFMTAAVVVMVVMDRLTRRPNEAAGVQAD